MGEQEEEDNNNNTTSSRKQRPKLLRVRLWLCWLEVCRWCCFRRCRGGSGMDGSSFWRRRRQQKHTPYGYGSGRLYDSYSCGCFLSVVCCLVTIVLFYVVLIQWSGTVVVQQALLPPSYRLYFPNGRISSYNASETIRPDTILWPKNWGHLVRHCDSLPVPYYTMDTTTRQDASTLRHYFFSGKQPCHGIVWLRTGSVHTNDTRSDVSLFATEILPRLLQQQQQQQPFVLITGDGDKDVPSEIHAHETILNSPNCVAWYTQNYDGTVQHPKLHPIPIGLDLHTPRFGYWSNDLTVNLQHMVQVRNRGLQQHQEQRLLGPLVPPWNPYTSTERRALQKILDDNNCLLPHVHVPRMVVTELWETTYTRYRFGFAPRGNGIDTHRLWEMLFFGMIPIVKTSSLDSLYIEHKLPVLIVQEYSDLCRAGYLEAAWKRLQPLWPAPDHVFTLQHWIREEHLLL